ncbi:MAG: hypothetical protein ACRD5H_03040 [Nitrososphaerales archaeon]
MSGNPPITIDWGQILSIIVGSAALSALISAIIAHFMTLREMRKKSEMEFVRDKLNMYSQLIYELDNMRHKYSALATATGEANPAEEHYAFSGPTEWNTAAESIDHIIKDHYLLLNPEIHKKWVWVKTLHARKEAITALREMRKMLATEYNQIRAKYVRKLSDIIPPVSVEDKA